MASHSLRKKGQLCAIAYVPFLPCVSGDMAAEECWACIPGCVASWRVWQ